MKKIIVIGCLCVLMVTAIFAGINFVNSDNVVEKLSKSVVLLEVYDDKNEIVATGSGFFIYDDKTIVTNYHVIEDAYSVTAITDDNTKFKISTMVDYNEEKDIAILRCDTSTGISYIPFAEMEGIKKGQEVIAIGSPLGIQNTVSTGIVSSFDVQTDVMKIHTTAPISSGSSGGLLATKDGKAIGITSASYIEGQNINIAIDIREVIGVYEDDLKKSTSFTEFFNTKEHLYQYKEVSVDEILNNYKYYQGEKVCVVGYVSTSLYDKEIEFHRIMNVLFLVNSAEDVLTKGSFPMIPYADKTTEYDRANMLESIMISNYGEDITIVDAGKKVKVYGEIDYSLQFERIGITPLKIEVIN